MRKSFKLVMVLALSLAVVAAGTSLALAQSEEPAAEEQAIERGDRRGPGGMGPRGGQRDLMIGGEVVSVDGNTITLDTIRGDQATVSVTDETTYHTKDGDASLADVVPGEHVGIRLTSPPEEGAELVAETVHVGLPDGPKHRPTVGEVTAVDGNTVTISTEDGEQQFTLPAIEAGQRLGVMADEDGNVKGLMYDPPERPQGERGGPPADEQPPAE